MLLGDGYNWDDGLWDRLLANGIICDWEWICFFVSQKVRRATLYKLITRHSALGPICHVSARRLQLPVEKGYAIRADRCTCT